MLLSKPPIAFINHLLAAAPWARDKLTPFAGQVAVIDVPPLALRLQVGADGLLSAAPGEIEAAVEITLPAGALPLVAQGMDALFRAARVSGQAEFAEAIGFVARNLRWDVEEDLSRAIGDIAAHRVTGAAQAFFEWHKQGFTRATENLSEYLSEDNRVLIKPQALRPFLDEVDDLRDAIARLEKRLDRLGG